MRKMIALGAAVLLAGCATGERSPTLAGLKGATYEKNSYGHEFISSVKFEYAGPAPRQQDALPGCVARVVDNRSISLSDSSGSFFGAYSGQYYSASKSRESGGGSVISHISDDKRSVIATGSTKYSYKFGLLPVEQSVRFTLAAAMQDESKVFTFEKLEYAQLDTGAVANDGYRQVGAWSGANPELAVASLKKVSDSINTCLST